MSIQLVRSDLPSLNVLTNPTSSTSATHCYKIIVTLGVLSASPYETRSTGPHLTSRRPPVHFPCNINFDPFTCLCEHNKTYGSLFSCLSHPAPDSTLLDSGFTLIMNDYGPNMPSLRSPVKGTLGPLAHPSTLIPRIPMQIFQPNTHNKSHGTAQ